MQVGIINLAYLGSAILFILGLKRLHSPTTAREGTTLSSLAKETWKASSVAAISNAYPLKLASAFA